MTIRAIFLCIATCTIAREALTSGSTATNGDNVCSSRKCLNDASELLELIDPTIDPCEDFYEFACGTFLKSEPVNINLRYRQILQGEIYADIEQLIAADIEPNEPKPFKLVKRLYKSCMDTAAIESKGLYSLHKYLRDLGGWPVVEGDSWNGRNFDWRRTIYKFRYSGIYKEYYIGDAVGYLVHFVVERDESHPSELIMSLKFPLGLLLPSPRAKNFYKRPDVHKAYRSSMMIIAWALGADKDRAMLEADEILSFEIKLTEIKLQTLELIELKAYNTMTIAGLNEKYPSVPWMTYLKTFLPPSISVTDETIINVPNPNYYVELEELMANTPKRVQANYVMSRIALRNAVIATEAMRTTVYDILSTRPRFPWNPDRPSYCAAEVIDHLWQGVIIMYAKKFLDTETLDAANAIIANLKSELKVKLTAYKRSDEAAWKLVLDKMAGLVTYVANPGSVLGQSKLDELYGNLEFTEDDYFGNMVRLSNYDHELGIKELEGPTPEMNKWENFRELVEFGTHFNRLDNRIRIEGGHLRGRFIGKDRPKYMNYGALGNIVSHEMIHAVFENSTYRESCGVDAQYCGLAERPEFDRQAQCLIDQYESYIVDNNGTKLDGKKTLTENLADVGGMRLAYDAYDRWAAVRPEEPKLPGLEQYSAKQMFWISAAVMRCEKITPDYLRKRISIQNHTVAKFRTIGIISNMPEFAEHFNCKAITLMNPAKRCDIWQTS